MQYTDHIAKLSQSKNFVVGDEVVVLVDYSLISGVVLKVNPKGIKVSVSASFGCYAYIRSFPYHKVVNKGCLTALVWELWKGKNGRGGYRLETILYPDLLMPVESIKASHYLEEESFGIITSLAIQKYVW